MRSLRPAKIVASPTKRPRNGSLCTYCYYYTTTFSSVCLTAMRVDCNNIVQMNAIVLYLLIHSICICCRDGLSLNIAKRLPVPKLLREEIVPKVRTLLIDNYDSYTYNLWQLLSDVNGIEPHVVYNNAYGGSWDALISGLQSFDNIVISPGPGSPDRQTDFGLCTDAILKSNIPLLGVCLGHQGMAHAYGGKVTRAQVPMHGRLSKLQHDDCGVFAGIDQNIEVVRYHSLVVDSPLPSVLRPTAWTLDGTIMGLEHRSKRQYGVQFHPESIKTACGRSLVTNFQGITLRHMQSTSSITNTVSVTKSKAFNFHNNSHQKAASVPSSTTPSTSTAAPQRHVHITTIPLPADSAITTEEVFSRLYGSHPASIWLDSQRPGPVNVRPQQPAGSHSPASSGRMTYMGALDTPGAYAVEYHGNRRLVKRTMTAPVNEVSKSHSTCSIEIQNRSIFEFLREKLAEEAASEPVITRSYRDIGTADAALASAEYDISITSALFGYLSYEVGQEAVNILAAQTDHSAHYDLSVETPYLDGARVNTSQPMALLMYPTQYVVYDHTQRVYRIVDLWNNDIAVPNSSQSLADRLAKIITTPTLAPETVYTGTEESSPAVTHVQALTGRKSQSAYKQDIAACLESISAGESYEVCLTTQFSGPAVGITDLTAHSLSMYKRLRALNPAPYASYLRYDPVELATGTTVAVSGLSAEVDKQKQTLQWYSPGGFAVCSTSPECFLKIDKVRWINYHCMSRL